MKAGLNRPIGFGDVDVHLDPTKNVDGTDKPGDLRIDSTKKGFFTNQHGDMNHGESGWFKLQFDYPPIIWTLLGKLTFNR